MRFLIALVLFTGVASADAELDVLLSKTSKLHGAVVDKSAEQLIRKLNDEPAERAAASYILALVNKDVPAFMKLVPPTGITVVEGRKRRHLTVVETEAAAKKTVPDGRPSFVHAFDEVEEVADVTKLDWSIERDKRSKAVLVNPNGGAGVARFKKGADGAYWLDGFSIERNED